MKTWYVVYTHANAEAKARSHLLRQGFATMLPTYRCWRSHARKREVVERPLFPRYLFVALDVLEQRWRPILSTVGVCELVRHGNAPTPMPSGLAEEIDARAACRQGSGLRPARPPRPPGADDAVLCGGQPRLIGSLPRPVRRSPRSGRCHGRLSTAYR